MQLTFHIANLNRYLCPKVFRGTLKVDLVSFRQRPAPSKISKSEKLSIIFVVFRGFFFWQNRFARPNSQLLPIACLSYSESYWSSGSFELLGQLFERHIFVNTVGCICKLDLTLRLIKSKLQKATSKATVLVLFFPPPCCLILVKNKKKRFSCQFQAFHANLRLILIYLLVFFVLKVQKLVLIFAFFAGLYKISLYWDLQKYQTLLYWHLIV